MSESTGSQFDPRFDPAFQRGFDGPIPAAEKVAAPQVEPIAQPAPAPPRPEPVATRPAAPVPAPQPSAAVVDEHPEDAQPLDDRALLLPEAGAAQSARNPFLVALGAIAVILIAGGLWLYAQSGAAFNSSQVQSQGDYNSLQAAIYAAPFISLLGVATLIALLFAFAVRWRSRR